VVATKGPTLVHLSARPDSPAVLSSTSLGDAPALADQGNDDVSLMAGNTVAVSSFHTGRIHLTS
jgi:hypothetical protein